MGLETGYKKYRIRQGECIVFLVPVISTKIGKPTEPYGQCIWLVGSCKSCVIQHVDRHIDLTVEVFCLSVHLQGFGSRLFSVAVRLSSFRQSRIYRYPAADYQYNNMIYQAKNKKERIIGRQ